MIWIYNSKLDQRFDFDSLEEATDYARKASANGGVWEVNVDKLQLSIYYKGVRYTSTEDVTVGD
jgi:hypothetical protein